jgi:hypothetical protein
LIQISHVRSFLKTAPLLNRFSDRNALRASPYRPKWILHHDKTIDITEIICALKRLHCNYTLFHAARASKTARDETGVRAEHCDLAVTMVLIEYSKQ